MDEIDSKVHYNIPTMLPLLPVRDVVIFTQMISALFVGRKGSIRAVEEAVSKNRLILLATQKSSKDENPIPEGIYRVGTVATIMRMLKLPDGRVKILVQGLTRAIIKDFIPHEVGYRVKLESIVEPRFAEHNPDTEALMRSVKKNSEKILDYGSGQPLNEDLNPP